MLRIFLLLFIVLSLILFVVPEEKLEEYDSKLIEAKYLIRDSVIKVKNVIIRVIGGEDPKDLINLDEVIQEGKDTVEEQIKEGIKDKKINIEVGIE